MRTDSLLLAFDRDGSVREIDNVGRLHVKLTNISKATVNPYRGKEIPGFEELGLEPTKIYHLFRDPEELAKAAPTFNGIQLLKKHVPVSADDHKPYDIVGATGTECVFEAPYLKNSLVVWASDAIEEIDSDDKKELSCGYSYRPDMTPGFFDGMQFDGVMRDIVGNHVALVKDGRAGPDVVIGDSKENLNMKSTRLAAFTLALTAAAVAPILAMDAKLEIPKDKFAPITSKNFKSLKADLLSTIRTSLTGKLRPGLALDASTEHVKTVLDALEGMVDGVDAEVDGEGEKVMEASSKGESPLAPDMPEPEKDKAFDAEPLKNFLREKGMGEDDIMKACDMMPKAMAGDADETPEEKKAREEKEKAAGKDANAMKDMVSKTAMDEALKLQATDLTKKIREGERAIRVALDKVRPYVGELPATMAFDTADDVYRHAAVTMGLPDAKVVHASALPAMISMAQKPGSRPVEVGSAHLAMDEAAVDSFNKRFPDAARIGSV